MTIQTRIVDSQQYDDCSDVLRWLREVVGVQPTFGTSEEELPSDVLFYLPAPWVPTEGGIARRIAIRSGTKLEWNPEWRDLVITLPGSGARHLISTRKKATR